MSTYTDNLGLEKPERGDYPNSWETPYNANLDAIDAAIASLEASVGTDVLNVITIDTDTAITFDDTVVLVDSSADEITITLPESDGLKHVIRIKDTGFAETNNVTIMSQGGDLIDGNTSYELDNNYESVTLVNDGSNWWNV